MTQRLKISKIVRMKVYDCFAFFNELDLLELRLTELDPIVDHFVLVEATRTFSKKEKPLFFQLNRDRYSKFEKKIIHIVVDKYPTFWTKFRPVTTWHYDNHQKQQVIQGLVKASDQDQIIFSDLDEIPHAHALNQALSDNTKYKVFEQQQAIYFLNNVCTRIHDFGGKAIAQQNREGFGRWRGSVLSKKKNISNFKKFRMVRDDENADISVIHDGGWHLSYMGGIESIINKMKSYAHTEYSGDDYTKPEIIKKAMETGTDPIKYGEKYELFSLNDPKIPYLKALKDNPEKWKHMIR